MALVNKCCCVCNLKHGYMIYAVLVLMGRICALSTALFFQRGVSVEMFGENRSYDGHLIAQLFFFVLLAGGGFYIGMNFAMAAALFFTLKGIAQTRAVLMLPYIVYLFAEIFIALIAAILVCVVTTLAWSLLGFAIYAAINGYVAICAISLYQITRQEERKQRLNHQQI